MLQVFLSMTIINTKFEVDMSIHSWENELSSYLW